MWRQLMSGKAKILHSCGMIRYNAVKLEGKNRRKVKMGPFRLLHLTEEACVPLLEGVQ